MFRKIKWLLFFVIVILIVYHRHLLGYGLKQLAGQLKIVFKAEQILEVIADPATPDSTRQKLMLIGRIREFGINNLGLTNTKNYTTFYNQHNKPVIWVVTAGEPYQLNEHLWHFPFLGDVPYKGFFNKEDALDEQNKLKRLFFDTDLGTVGGWSTLGFFTDPVLSNMLKRTEGRLAELILHEMAHATIYFSDSTEFNENIATFIGEKGAEIFLENSHKNDSLVLHQYKNFLEDEKMYGSYMLECCARLDSLYKTFTGTMSTYDKSLAKYRFIAGLMSGIKNLPLNNPGRYTWDFVKDPLPNNTHFLDYKRYRSGQENFHVVFDKQAAGDMKTFISLYKK